MDIPEPKSVDKKMTASNRNLIIGILIVVVLFVGVISTSLLLQKESVDYDARAEEANLNACGQNGGFCETFDGAPAAPQNLGGIAGKNLLPNWTMSVHSRDFEVWETLDPQSNVMHGPDCSAPPATHFNNSYEGAVFNCKNHVMTAMESGDGYGLIAMTPNAMVDFANGPAIVQWEMSTNRMSTRDWPDIWITPWNDATILPFDAGDVDLQGPVANAVHFDAQANQNSWNGGIIINGNKTNFDSQWWVSMNEGIAANTNQDAVRQTFRATITKNHVKMERLASPTAPSGIVWFDQDIPTLNFDKGVVQISHHIYNPTKDNAGVPATWHWDTVAINPAVPFTMIQADKRFVNTNGAQITFDKPAPANSLLKFAGIGTVEYSLNNGSTWQTAAKQLYLGHPEHFSPYSFSIPEGTQKVNFRFSNDSWFQGPFMAEDFTIWSTTSPVGGTNPTPTTGAGTPTNTPMPTPTSTPIPTNTPTPTPTPTRTPTPTPTRIPTPTPTTIVVNPTPTSQPNTNPAWVGQYYNYSTGSTKGLNGTPVLVRSDPSINFNWGLFGPGSGVKNDKFSSRWTSRPFMSAGTYQFKAVSDDGVRVYLDGQLLSSVSLWNDHGATTRTQNVNVSEGFHTIVVEYYENRGAAIIQFSYKKL